MISTSVASYQHWVQELVDKQNRRCQAKLEEERRWRLPDRAAGSALVTWLAEFGACGRFAVEALGCNRWFVRACRAAGLDIVVVHAADLGLKNTGKKTILIYSDLKEELPEGYVRDIPFQLEGFDIVALNVTKLRSDNVDPREYMDRLEDWQRRIEEGGGSWRVINDMDRLERIISS